MESKRIDISEGRIIKRIFSAISQIGYTPQSAILDIVDNSVSAESDRINIILKVSERKYLTSSHNIEEVIIFDNGKGMDSEGIQNALTLGTIREYDKDSLSKFGFGLKSAGSSLGYRISVISKKKDTKESFAGWYLDLEDLDDGYKISAFSKEEIEEEIAIYNDISSISNTIVKISNCAKKIKRSSAYINDKLKAIIGATFYYSINDGLEIAIGTEHKSEIKLKTIEPNDMLFLGDAIKEFDLNTYDGIKPVFIYDEEISIDQASEKARLEICLFPKSKMQTSPKLISEERKRIKEYDVSSKNKGCYIYRNKRLISWGNNLEGIISRDDFGVRARLLLKTAHDEILDVDVSKQRLNFPETVLEDIRNALKKPIEISREIFKKCDLILQETDDTREGIGFSQKNRYLEEEDPDVEIESSASDIDIEKSKKRTASIEQSSSEEDKKTKGDLPINLDDTFLRIRYSDSIENERLFNTYLNRENGTFITINKNHVFYNQVLSRLNSEEDKKQIIEAILWTLGVAENKTQTNLTKISDEEINIVLRKFHKVFQNNLSNWSRENSDLINE